jgi:hypothetical protein
MQTALLKTMHNNKCFEKRRLKFNKVFFFGLFMSSLSATKFASSCRYIKLFCLRAYNTGGLSAEIGMSVTRRELMRGRTSSENAEPAVPRIKWDLYILKADGMAESLRIRCN